MENAARTLFFVFIVGPIALVVLFVVSLSDPEKAIKVFFEQPWYVVGIALTIGIGGFLSTIGAGK